MVIIRLAGLAPCRRSRLNSNVRPHVKTLVATRCTLEPQVVAHAKEMFVVLSDPALYEFENAPPESEAWLSERFARLESRVSKDGTTRWLNWVVRLPTGQLAGYTQATVRPDGITHIAYEIASKFWRQGIGSSAVAAMLVELEASYNVHTFIAVLKARNFRSKALLKSLGFSAGTWRAALNPAADPDELVMHRRGRAGTNAA